MSSHHCVDAGSLCHLVDATGSCISLLHGKIPGLGCLQEEQNDLVLEFWLQITSWWSIQDVAHENFVDFQLSRLPFASGEYIPFN